MTDPSTLQFAFIAASALALTFMLVALFQWRAAQRAKSRAHQLEVEMASVGSYAEQIESLKGELEEAVNVRIAAEKSASVSEEKVATMQQRMKEWEEQKEQMKQAATASVMEAGQKLSTKLLEDHKREADESKKDAEKRLKAFQEQFESITKSVGAIQAQSLANAEQVHTVMRALTHPAGAGEMSETHLENSLKNLGLQAGIDFDMQYHATDEGGNLRPDAVIYLPQDMVMVIDSKASKFWMELAQAEGTDEEEKKLQQFVTSMRQHIDALGRKQYADVVAAMMKKKGKKTGLMFNVMYVSSDAALEKLRLADAELLSRCEKQNVFMAGPASLSALFSLARQQIAAARQDENQQVIIDQLKQMMANLVVALGHVDGVGKNIQQSAKKFSDFAKSLNKNVLPKLRQMEALGVSPAKNKSIPLGITTYDVHSHEDILSGDAEEIDTTLAIEEKKAG